MALLENDLLYKHEDLNLIPSTHTENRMQQYAIHH